MIFKTDFLQFFSPGVNILLVKTAVTPTLYSLFDGKMGQLIVSETQKKILKYFLSYKLKLVHIDLKSDD